MDNLFLYRKVSLKEVSDIQRCLFRVPETRVFDTRKWFTDSIIGAARFHNPYVAFEEKEVLLKIGVSPLFWEDENVKLTLFKNEKHRFYRNSSLKDPVVVCQTHLVTPKYSSYGLREDMLPVFNSWVNSIDVYNLAEACPLYVKSNFENSSISSIFSSSCQESEYSFYIVLPFDLALALKKEKLIFSEGTSPMRKRKVSCDLENLKNGNKDASCFAIVRLIPCEESLFIINNIKSGHLKELDITDIFKINKLIASGDIADYDKDKDFHQSYASSGSNARVIHIPLEYQSLGFAGEKYADLKQAFLGADFEKNLPKDIYEVLKATKGCHQLDPKQIDDVYDHSIKSVQVLDKVMEFLGFIYPLDEDDITLMKIGLLLHDIGKPFMPVSQDVDRYTQFCRHYEIKGQKIVNDIFNGEVQKDIIMVMGFISDINGKKGYHRFFENIKRVVSFSDIDKYVWMMFLMCTAHILSLNPQKFSFYYNDLLNFLKEYCKYRRRVWRTYDSLLVNKDLINTLPGFEDYLVTCPQNQEIKSEASNILLLDILKDFDSEIKDEDFELKKEEYGLLPEQMEIETAIWTINNSNLLALLQEAIESVNLDVILKSKAHGINHNEKVAFLGSLIGFIKGISYEDMQLFLLAALYHDCGRENDFDSMCHGAIGAKIFKELYSLSLDEESLNIVMFMIEAHAISDSSIVSLLKKYNVPKEKQARYLLLTSILKDADALDRVRFTNANPYTRLNPKYLRNEESGHLIKVAHDLNEHYHRQIVYEGENIPRKLYRATGYFNK